MRGQSNYAFSTIMSFLSRVPLPKEDLSLRNDFSMKRTLKAYITKQGAQSSLLRLNASYTLLFRFGDLVYKMSSNNIHGKPIGKEFLHFRFIYRPLGFQFLSLRLNSLADFLYRYSPRVGHQVTFCAGFSESAIYSNAETMSLSYSRLYRHGACCDQ